MKKFAISGIVIVFLGCAAAYGFYVWFLCRFYVDPGCMAIVTAKAGETPPPGTILVQRGQKGIWAEVLPEGRHFLDPIMYEYKIVPTVNIPLGKVGIVTSKVGKDLPPGEIIAADRHDKGVWRNVLGPGIYRLNPQGYNVDIVDAISIPVGYVGVITSQTGPSAKPGEFAAMGEKGVFKDILQPGLYYINPRAYQVNVIEIGMNQVSMSGKSGSVIELKNKIESASGALDQMVSNTLNVQREQRMRESSDSSFKIIAQYDSNEDGKRVERKVSSGVALGKTKSRVTTDLSKAVAAKVSPSGEAAPTVIYGVNRFVEFPSRDGFKIMLDMTVEFEMLPGNISTIYMLYGDLPQVVEKILIPQIMSISRLKGSSYKAQDFIMGEGRETFQNNLKNDLVNTMAEKSIIIHNALIRNVEIPANILKPIRDSSVAKEQNLTNQSLQETAKIEAELNTQVAMINQKRLEVEQETKKLVAETNANQKNAVQKIHAETSLQVASIQLERAEIMAKIAKMKGETEVKRKFMLDNEKALGNQMKANALGKIGSMADIKLIESLSDEVKVKIIYAGEGTLWTDMKSGAVSIDK